MLAAPLNAELLGALADAPMRQAELRRKAGSPAQTTLRAHLNQLTGVGAVSRWRRDRFPGTVEHELTAAGRDLLCVHGTLGRWLAEAPAGALEPGSHEARAAVKALADGWSATILRALAARPITLTELDRMIGGLNYPSLERKLGAMRLAGLILPTRSPSRGTPYGVTLWLRLGIAPIVAAARWEARHLAAETPPIKRLDVETILLLSTPLLKLSDDLEGSCRMAVEVPDGSEPTYAGALIRIAEGRVFSCTARLQGDAEAWVSGPASAWLSALVETKLDHIQIGGDSRLSHELLDGLHAALFGAQTTSRT